MMIIEQAKKVLKIEADGILGLIQRVDHRFEEMVDLIFTGKGRLIVAGIGKSGIVARKIAATLNSTGTRSLFLHPVEAMHGDLGQVMAEDVLLALSYSGETDELNHLIPSVRQLGCNVIAFTGNPDSNLARLSDIAIDVSVEQEACPLGLAPTTSTTAMQAMGDALAVVLINRRQFKSGDFKRFHPGGNLGQRLASQVADMMVTGDKIPVVSKDAPLMETVAVIDAGGLGVTLVIESGKLLGIVTDGDLRRMLTQHRSLQDLTAGDVMTVTPRTVLPKAMAYDVLHLMELHQITVVPVVDEAARIVGVVHLHDILGKGDFRFNGRVNGS